jgi:hypothetical protein
MAKKQATVVVSPEAVAAYAWLARPDEGQQYSDGKYKVTLVLDSSNENFFKELIQKSDVVAQEEWGKVPSNLRYCLKDGDDTEKEEFAGKTLITCKTKYQPGFVDSSKKPLDEDTFPASGDMIRASFALIPYKTGGNAGVTAQLRNVMLMEKRNNGGSQDDFAEVQAEEAVANDNDDDFDL